jgi:hypothetical protein
MLFDAKKMALKLPCDYAATARIDFKSILKAGIMESIANLESFVRMVAEIVHGPPRFALHGLHIPKIGRSSFVPHR